MAALRLGAASTQLPSPPRPRPSPHLLSGSPPPLISAPRFSVSCQNAAFSRKEPCGSDGKRRCLVAKSSPSESSSPEDSKSTEEKTPFGYTRKDVLLIGLGVTLAGVALKYGLEVTLFFGDLFMFAFAIGNAVQLVVVLGMTVAWISSYMFRVASKDMTYAQQLREYEKQVMEKRLESLSEAELQVLLEQVEEEKQRLGNRRSSS